MNRFKNVQYALQDEIIKIYRKYPSIFSYEQLSVYSHVYYPISLVTVLIEESVRQPFTPFEQIVLELLKSGFNTSIQIAEAMGLPEVFVQEIINELEENEISSHFELTVKGEYCYTQKSKFTTQFLKQTVQYDPLLQVLLFEQPIDEKYLLTLKETDIAISHVLPKSHIALSEIQSMFNSKSDGDEVVTVQNIKKIVEVNLFFVEVAALLFNLVPHPYIFFPDENGNCINLLTLSEANTNYFLDDNRNKIIVNRLHYYDVWLSVKQIKDDMKRTLDNIILRRDIIGKVNEIVELSNAEHTVLTDSGITILIECNTPFIFNRNNYYTIKSLEWTKKFIPYLVLEQDEEYGNFIGYSECYDKKVNDTSRLIFQIDKQFNDVNKLYMTIGEYLSIKQTNIITIDELYDILIIIQEEQNKISKSL